MNYSLIVPVFNEERCLEHLKEDVFYILDKHKNVSEVIIVNDGSTDNTIEMLQNFFSSESVIKIISHKKNKGYGAALKTGIFKCSQGNVIILDADGTYPAKQLSRLMEVYEQKEDLMVVGARSGKHVKIPMIRRPAKWFIKKLAEFLVNEEINDLNSGLRIINKKMVHLFKGILPDGFSFTTTITLAMLASKYSIAYVNIDYFKRIGKSKISPLRDFLNFIQLVIRTIIYFNPLKVFLPLSFMFVIVAVLVLGLGYFVYGLVMDISFIILFFTGIHLLSIGIFSDLIVRKFLMLEENRIINSPIGKEF